MICLYSLLFVHSFIHSFTFKGVFHIQEYIYSHLRDVFIHIQRVIYSFSIFCAPPLRIIRSPSFRFQNSIWQMKAKDPKNKVLHWQDPFLLQLSISFNSANAEVGAGDWEHLIKARVSFYTVNNGVICHLHGQSWIRHDWSNCTSFMMYFGTSLPPPPPSFHLFGLAPIFARLECEKLLRAARILLASNGNACYADYSVTNTDVFRT